MAEMTAEREGAILERALERCDDAQLRRQMIERLAHMTLALCDLERAFHSTNFMESYAQAKDHVLEEIAVVQIMLNQMQLRYGDCTEWEIKKLEYLARRLGMEDGAGE